MRPILIGTLGALFFSAAFIFNRSMELEGGSWAWSASLRFFFMLPMLLVIVGFNKNIKPVLIHIRNKPIPWIIWSTVGFGLFYAPLAFGTVYAPGWLVAATRSEEHTSELQSRGHLVCRLLLEKKNWAVTAIRGTFAARVSLTESWRERVR